MAGKMSVQLSTTPLYATYFHAAALSREVSPPPAFLAFPLGLNSVEVCLEGLALTTEL